MIRKFPGYLSDMFWFEHQIGGCGHALPNHFAVSAPKGHPIHRQLYDETEGSEWRTSLRMWFVPATAANAAVILRLADEFSFPVEPITLNRLTSLVPPGACENESTT